MIKLKKFLESKPLTSFKKTNLIIWTRQHYDLIQENKTVIKSFNTFGDNQLEFVYINERLKIKMGTQVMIWKDCSLF